MKTTKKNWIAFCLFAASAMLFTTARASVIADNSGNGVLLSAFVDGSYKGATTSDPVYGVGGLSAIGHADPTSPSPPVSGPAIVDPGAAVGPSSGTGSIDAYAMTSFAFGAPLGAGAYDTFMLRSDLTASALSAGNSAGEQADALVASMNQLAFFLDSSASGLSSVAPDTAVATAVLGGMRDLFPYETGQLDVLQDGSTVIASLLPGGSGLSISLLAGHSYALVLSHALNVPYGIDPSTTLTVSGTLLPSTVPEPPVSLLIGALLMIGVAVRRQPGRRITA